MTTILALAALVSLQIRVSRRSDLVWTDDYSHLGIYSLCFAAGCVATLVGHLAQAALSCASSEVGISVIALYMFVILCSGIYDLATIGSKYFMRWYRGCNQKENKQNGSVTSICPAGPTECSKCLCGALVISKRRYKTQRYRIKRLKPRTPPPSPEPNTIWHARFRFRLGVVFVCSHFRWFLGSRGRGRGFF